MDANELLRKLKKLGAKIDRSHGKGSHARVTLNGQVTYLPMHSKRDIPIGTFRAILKQLKLKPDDLR